MASASLRTDEKDRNLIVETTEEIEDYPGTVYLWDTGTGGVEGVFVNTLDLLKAIAEASGYKVTVEYTPINPQPVTVVFSGAEED